MEWKIIMFFNVKKIFGKADAKTLKEKNEYDSMEKKYRNIPLYTDYEMKNALIDNSEEVLNEYIGRQALNGYVGTYDEWVVGRGKDGKIVKTNKRLLFEENEEDVKKRGKRIRYTQSHALYGSDLKGKRFCKFTYKIKDQKLYSIHTKLVREYKAGTIMTDSGFYGGLHFVELDNLKICLDYLSTFYGDRIALIKPIEDEVYYEYTKDVYMGNKIYVESVMDFENIDTWKILNEMTGAIKENKDKICIYLNKLSEMNGKKYDECINYIKNLQ